MWRGGCRQFCCIAVKAGVTNQQERGTAVNKIIYIVGLVVVVLAVLAFFGYR